LIISKNGIPPLCKGKSTNKESGLLRNLRYILDSGKPLGNFVYTFYEENNEHYVLGTLVDFPLQRGGIPFLLIINKLV